MKLLIIGAGGLGQVTRDIAETMGDFTEISYVDDKSEIAIGTIDELEKLRMKYDAAFVSIGNNEIRKKLQVRCKELGYIIPAITSNAAYISREVFIGEGVLVQPGAVINTNAVIKDGVIVSIGALIDHDTEVDEYCHINTGAIVKAGAHVPMLSRVDAGEIIKGFY